MVIKVTVNNNINNNSVQLRCDLEFSQKIVIACCILHNMYTVWNRMDDYEDEDEDDDDDEDDHEDDDGDDGNDGNDGNDDDDDRLEAGKRKRDAIRHAMI